MPFQYMPFDPTREDHRCCTQTIANLKARAKRALSLGLHGKDSVAARCETCGKYWHMSADGKHELPSTYIRIDN
jgi:hypothetical protein